MTTNNIILISIVIISMIGVLVALKYVVTQMLVNAVLYSNTAVTIAEILGQFNFA